MNRPLLSVCIPTVPSRAAALHTLYTELTRQLEGVRRRTWNPVEVRVLCDLPHGQGGLSVGEKRDLLLQDARGEYTCFVDDDDTVLPTYLATLVDGCLAGLDAVAVHLRYLQNGVFQYPIHHSRAYGWGDPTCRPLCHLNPIRTVLARKIQHRPLYYGEDIYWADAFMASGLVQAEAPTTAPILEYRAVTHTYDADGLRPPDVNGTVQRDA